jgi:hypothetical protein
MTVSAGLPLGVVSPSMKAAGSQGVDASLLDVELDEGGSLMWNLMKAA